MTTENQKLRDALQRIQYKAKSLADAQVIALEALALPTTEPVEGGEASGEFRAALMGYGRVAIGQCKERSTGTPGIIYLDMGAEQRAIEADTSDLFIPGSTPDESKVLACIYFTTPDSVRQSIAVLHELLHDQFGTTQPASHEQAQEPVQADKAALQMLVAGALFDFAGYLTTLPEPLSIGASELAGPMVEHLKKWAETRKLPLDEAAVMSWQDAIATQPQAQDQKSPPWLGPEDESTLRTAASVMQDVLSDIGEWEDQTLADAVRSSMDALLDMAHGVNLTQPKPQAQELPDERAPACYAHIDASGRVRAVLSEPRGAVKTPLYTSAALAAKPVPDDVRKDAERYRWLRENAVSYPERPDELDLIVPVKFAEDFRQRTDSAIDAAIAAQGGQS